MKIYSKLEKKASRRLITTAYNVSFFEKYVIRNYFQYHPFKSVVLKRNLYIKIKTIQDNIFFTLRSGFKS